MPFRDDYLICIELGSYETRAILGLSESLTPPKLRLRTVVAKPEDSDEFICGDEEIAAGLEEDSALEIIHPLVAGRVSDWPALIAFLDSIMFKFTADLPPARASEFPVVLIVPPQWSAVDKEKVTQVFMERLMRPAFMIVDMPLASLYACNSMTGVVIDVGYEKTDVTCIIDSIPIGSSHVSIPIGGSHLTRHFQTLLLADLPLDQATQVPRSSDRVDLDFAERIKCSQICEIPAESGHANGMAFQPEEPDSKNTEEEGVLDIAAVVASGKTREYLARVQAEKNGATGATQTVVPNSQLTHNTIDMTDGTYVIGQDRFKVCDPLLETNVLLAGIYDSITSKAIEFSRRQDLWDNVVIVGGGAKIQGFRERLVQKLQARFGSGLSLPQTELGATPSYNAYPASIRGIRIPVHFPEWNNKTDDGREKGRQEEATFLGGCIIAHIAFSSTEGGASRLYMTRADWYDSLARPTTVD